MKVILTEKPSVARDIAAFVKANKRFNGYFEGNGYDVTWAFGHLVMLKEPGEYDPALKRWSLDRLPFIPNPFELKLINNKDSKKQFAIIKSLFKSAEEIICATDAGREGELIFRYILDMTKCKKPCKRLWLNSLTQEAIEEAFNNIYDSKKYYNLYEAARCRSEADWIVGINGTRNFTVRYGLGALWSIGRVQTPVLSMIVNRDDEISTFISKPFWELMASYRDVKFKYKGDRYDNENDAKNLLKSIQNHPFVITKVEGKTEKFLPPSLFNLTDLQRNMNKNHGFSAAYTLEMAQSLYENKFITYPRTDSRFLSSDMKVKLIHILHKLKNRYNSIEQLNLDKLNFSKRIINEKKVTDHHAIIPTGTLPHGLSADQQIVYDAITTQLISAFYPPCIKKITLVEGLTNDITFQAHGQQVISEGWAALFPKKHEKTDEQNLPSFTIGESGDHKPFIKEGKTTPPQHFTENALLGAMETAGKLVEDETLKEAMKNKGLGTPATRSAIIETLLQREYIVRNKKRLNATDNGRYLVALVRNPNLKSQELTGEWESKLKAIEEGLLDPKIFMKEIVQFTNELIHKDDLYAVDTNILGNCPLCQNPIMQGNKGFGCSKWKEGCKFVLWKEYKDIVLNTMQIRKLLQNHILLPPITLTDTSKMILYLSDSGKLMDIVQKRKK